MTFDSNDITEKLTFRQLFRLVFVAFSLYLTGDAFYRWDGFSYYASFYEFLPAVALASILWSIIGVIVAIAVWVSFVVCNRACRLIGLKIEYSHLLLYVGVFILLGMSAWKVKKIIWPNVQTMFHIKIIVFVLMGILSIFPAWLFRNKAGQWFEILKERITPLVWLFGIFVFISVPIVAYNAWFKGSEKRITKEIIHSSGDHGKRPNIILLTFDALAAREMSLYGYPVETTPFISKWSKNATVFAMAEAGSNFTTPAVAGLMTGKRVWTHQTYHIEGMKPVRSDLESLPALLKNYGYFNMAFVANPFASVGTLGISGSFDKAPLASEFGGSDSLFGWKFGVIDRMLYRAFGDNIRIHNWIFKNDFIFSKVLNLISRNIYQTPVPPEEAFSKFFETIDADLTRPFFAWIHVFPPHDPYLAPEPFMGRFNTSLKLRTYKEQEKLIRESYKYLFQHQAFPEELVSDIDLMRDYYDEMVAYTDRAFEDFIQELDKRKLQNTMIVVTADHGESFDHGYFTHGGPFLYEQVTHIPLIIKAPAQVNGSTVDERVEQIDIPATILDFADISVPSWMEGRSLVPLIKGEKLSPVPAWSMNLQAARSRGNQIGEGSIAVWEGDYKLIHYLEKDESLLFNLKQDPNELNDLINTEPEVGRYLLDLIQDNLKKANKRIEMEGTSNDVSYN